MHWCDQVVIGARVVDDQLQLAGLSRLGLVSLELLEGSQHVGSGYRLRSSRVLHPSLDELLNELLSGVHSGVLAAQSGLATQYEAVMQASKY